MIMHIIAMIGLALAILDITNMTELLEIHLDRAAAALHRNADITINTVSEIINSISLITVIALYKKLLLNIRSSNNYRERIVFIGTITSPNNYIHNCMVDANYARSWRPFIRS